MSAELAGDWLELASVASTSMTTAGTVTVGNVGNCYHSYPLTTYMPTYTFYEPAKPIKLTLAEVDRLRKAAKADTALKSILQKFTSQIEIIVEL